MTDLRFNSGDVKLQRLNAIRLMIRDCILPDGYTFPSRFDEAIVLSDIGEEWLERLREDFPTLTASDAKAALLTEFAIGDDLTFDPLRTDFELMRSLLSEEVTSCHIRYPWVFGRVLDDAYIRMHGNIPQNSLGHSDSMDLLLRLPQGVFQVADVTVGPLGMVVVPEFRYLPPTTCGPAIECPDPGCVTIHHSDLRTGSTLVSKAYYAIRPDVSVDMALSRLIEDLSRPDEEYYRIDNRWGLPWLLANGLSEVERRSLFTLLLKENSDGIREFFGRCVGTEAASRGAAQIAASVGEAELFQLLMAVTDKSLVLALEEAVDMGLIVFGDTEIRRPVRPKHAYGGLYSAQAQASRLGVRFSPPNYQKAPMALKHLIATIYRENKPEDLGWRLRNIDGDDDMSKLSRFMRTTPPRDVVRKLIIDDRELLQAAFNMLRYGRFKRPASEADELDMIDRVLWKMGYPSLEAPESPERLVLQYTGELSRMVSAVNVPADRANEIRSVGSILFAALEDLLNSTLRYVCWTLLADHFAGPRQRRFTYHRSRAERFLNEIMRDPTAAPERFSYDGESRNPLGVLVQSLRVLADKCQVVLDNGQDNLRPPEQMPWFSARSGESVYTFPFTHTKLILDLSEDSSRRLLSALSEAAATLEDGRIVTVRNRLAHHTNHFPSASEISAACTAIEQVVAVLVRQGMLPTIYVRVGESIDQFNNTITSMSDGEGRSVEILGPSELDFCGLPKPDQPQMIMTAARIVGTGGPVRLRYEEDSEFAAMWEDYLTDISEPADVQQLG